MFVKFMDLTRCISMNAFYCRSLLVYCYVLTAEGAIIRLKGTNYYRELKSRPFCWTPWDLIFEKKYIWQD